MLAFTLSLMSMLLYFISSLHVSPLVAPLPTSHISHFLPHPTSQAQVYTRRIELGLPQSYEIGLSPISSAKMWSNADTHVTNMGAAITLACALSTLLQLFSYLCGNLKKSFSYLMVHTAPKFSITTRIGSLVSSNALANFVRVNEHQTDFSHPFPLYSTNIDCAVEHQFVQCQDGAIKHTPANNFRTERCFEPILGFACG
jgi:hypothetical protein